LGRIRERGYSDGPTPRVRLQHAKSGYSTADEVGTSDAEGVCNVIHKGDGGGHEEMFSAQFGVLADVNPKREPLFRGDAIQYSGYMLAIQGDCDIPTLHRMGRYGISYTSIYYYIHYLPAPN